MELLNQLDGFDDLGRVKIIMATNRPLSAGGLQGRWQDSGRWIGENKRCIDQ